MGGPRGAGRAPHGGDGSHGQRDHRPDTASARRGATCPCGAPPAGCGPCAAFVAYAGRVAGDGNPVRAGGHLLTMVQDARAALASGRAADAAAILASMLTLAGVEAGAPPLRAWPGSVRPATALRRAPAPRGPDAA